MAKNRRKQWLTIVMALVAAVLMVMPVQQAAMAETRGDLAQRYADMGYITVDDVTYRPKKRITTILVMGIDLSYDENPTINLHRNGGQCDFLRVLVIDDDTKTITQIPIDRDTMTPIVTLDVMGRRAGTRVAQVCLSHGYGDGKEESAKLAVDAVSNMLMNVPIDHYMALRLQAVPTLNDWVGGVTVTIEDDFSELDPEMVVGATIRLQGKQAELFTRTRMTIGDGTNASRMRRQQVYIAGLTELIAARLRENKNAAGSLYDAVSEWLMTDFSRGRLVNEAWAAKDYTHNTRNLTGEHTVGTDGFIEFHMDEASMREVVLNTFYDVVQ